MDFLKSQHVLIYQSLCYSPVKFYGQLDTKFQELEPSICQGKRSIGNTALVFVYEIRL